jgi:hypothetical protein
MSVVKEDREKRRVVKRIGVYLAVHLGEPAVDRIARAITEKCTGIIPRTWLSFMKF